MAACDEMRHRRRRNLCEIFGGINGEVTSAAAQHRGGNSIEHQHLVSRRRGAPLYRNGAIILSGIRRHTSNGRRGGGMKSAANRRRAAENKPKNPLM
jgi:hypothetical protein